MGSFLIDKIPKYERKVLESFNRPYYEIKKGHMVKLNLSGEKIDSFPENILSLKYLTELDLSNNTINPLSESIGSLKSLKKLYLAKCNLSYIPECIGNLKKLKVLNLFRNHLKKLPDTFGNLIHLAELHLRSNNLISLPNNIGNLQLLRKLYLNNNDLTSLPESFENLNKLRILHIENNRFYNIPKCLDGLKSLKEIKIDRNPLKTLYYVSSNILDHLGSYIYVDYLTPKGKRLFLEYWGRIMPLDDSLNINRKKILLEYYQKSPSTLVLDYFSNPKLLTIDNQKRLIHEVNRDEIKILENGVLGDDPILNKIIERDSFELSSGLKIYL